MAKKTYNGAKNNKERSMQKLIDAVGCIIRTQGYTVDIPGMLTRGFRGKLTRQLAGER